MYYSHPDKFLEAIMYAEREQEPKVSEGAIQIQKTGELYYAPKFNRLPETFKILKPDPFFKIGVLAFLLTINIVLGFEYAKGRDLLALIVVHTFFAALTIGGIYQIFFDRSSNYTIRVDTCGITIKEQTFLWKNIYATAILTKRTRGTNKYLVIAMADENTYECFDLGGFHSIQTLGFPYKLARYIEHFKQQ